MPVSDARPLDDVSAYYDATWTDYRALWLNPGNRALHFGYWRDGITTHAESLVEINRVMADLVGIQPGQRVLDAGCGVGGTSFWLAEQRGARPVGITPYRGQLERAERYARERGHDARPDFVQADYLANPFTADSFDVVWTQESLCHTDRKAQFAREAARVLRPGGQLVCAEYVRRARPLADRDEQVLHRWLSGWVIPDIPTADEMTDMLVAAGFIDVVIRDVSEAVLPSLRRLHRITTALYPLAVAMHAVGLRNDRQHGNVVGARSQWRATRRRLWHYGLITARKRPE